MEWKGATLMAENNVSKKDPLKYGEFLLNQISTKNVTQSELAKQLGQNRTELGRYVRIGKWSKKLKEYIISNRNYLRNTVIINAAREFKDENDAFVYLQSVVAQGQDGALDLTPIPNQHMLKSLLEENQKLKEDVSSLQCTLASLTNQIDTLKECINQSVQHGWRSDKKNSYIWNIPLASLMQVKLLLTKLINILKFKLIELVLWFSAVPITAVFIEHCLKNFSIERLPYLSLVPVTYLALALAIAFDLLIFSLLSQSRHLKFSIFTAVMLISLNAAGAYFISSKNSNESSFAESKKEQDAIKKEIDLLRSETAQKRAEYLISKWPNQINPNDCEEKKMDCGNPYTSRSKRQFLEYLSSNEMMNAKIAELKNVREKSLSIPNTAPNDIYWHIGYYITIWVLLLITVWQTRIVGSI